MAVKLDKWLVAQKKHRLSDRHTMMARELGLNPDKLGKVDNHKQETWKAPLPQFIEDIYFKRFKREEPLIVKSIKQLIAKEKFKKEKQKKAKGQKRKAKLQGDGSTTDDGEITENPVEQANHNKKVKYNDIKPIARVQLESGDTPETILQKEAHIFDKAFDLYEKERVALSELGFMLKKIYPQYKPRRYGCKTLGEVYEKLDKYEVIQVEEKGACSIVYKKEK
ncbi:OST-HTH/LOTUS domain-containing protein [Dysgonomonas alginatilytica]|uniref:OST-HTH/LOTUS domain-containing protein n=1 Tax=Dysgonomonas alginatilytica TaxID=1605892 RepID=A0A2V3PJM6_9BACT|nr:OST-HTH/LOTUS domain-containing protein [Dysgonomonas alginatilytica]